MTDRVTDHHGSAGEADLLPEEFECSPNTGAVMVTRRVRPVLAVMPWELYESITETLEVLSDRELMGTLRKSLADVRKGPDLQHGAGEKMHRSL